MQAARFRALDLCRQPIGDSVLPEFFRQTCQQMIRQGKTFRIVLPLSLADEIVNPDVTVIFQ